MRGAPWWFRAIFALIALCAVGMIAYTAVAARACAQKGGIFIASQYTWPICLERDSLR